MRFLFRIFFQTRTILRVLLFLVTLKLLAVASTGEGVEAFRKGDYSKAAEEFADAEQKSPNDLRIIFNRGAALAASGKFDEAVQTLRKSAVAKDADIASKSLTLLGSLAVSRAKQLLAEKPEETPSEQRPSVLDQLLAAEKYYTESLLVEPSEPVRMNLEQIRAWKNKIQTEWDSFDRSQKRSDDITKRLQWFEDWEGTINNAIRQTNEIPDSPKKFQTFYETAREQNKLTEEISVLQNELQQTLQQTLQQKSADNKLSEQERQGMETIVRELERIHELTGEVGNLLYKFRGDKALGVAREAADLMNRIRLNLSPFEVIVQEAEKKQATLCNNNPANGNKQTETPDITEQIREEQLVANGMPLMVFRAKHGLQELAAGHGADQDQPEKLNAIRESMNLAVQYGPEIQTLAEESSQLLTENKSEDAFPKQNKALELLREILKPLQQNQQNQNQQQNQQQQNNQEQQNQQNQNQEQNQQQQNQQNNQQQKQDQKQDQQQQDQQDKKTTQSDEQNPTESKQEQQKNDVTSQQKNEEMERVERMLRQVKRRQQEANEKREKLRTLLLQAVPVEKDW